jgi:large repetitive protein
MYKLLVNNNKEGILYVFIFGGKDMKGFIRNSLYFFYLCFLIVNLASCSWKSSDSSSDLGDAPSKLAYSTTSAVYTLNAAITPNTPIYTGTATYWSASPSLPAGLTLNTSTGIISGTPTAVQSVKTYIITASSSGGSTTVTITIMVAIAPPAALSYSTTSAVYTLNTAITPNTPTYTGTATYWLVDPKLPAGLTLKATTGVISGTPTKSSSVAQYTITASNAYGSTTATISITVNEDPPTALSYSTTSCMYTINEVITNNTPTVTGTVTSWSISPALPSGLTLNATTGIISGTPNTLQSAKQYKITAINTYGSTTATISITVNLAPPSALSYSTTSCVYTKNLAIEENTPTYTGTVTSWSVIPSLPEGLTLNTTTGVISGTPNTWQNTIQYTITAGNAYGSTTVTISITINLAAPKALSYSTTSCVYTINTVIPSNNPTVTGTITSWMVNPALPSGLTLNTTTGVISGTPTVTQETTEYIIVASNPSGVVSATISITINLAAPTALSYSTTSCVYTRNEVITNNTPTVTGTVTSWSVSPSLPAGLTLNTTTGVISGTPTATQSATNYTITATNSGGSTTATISITVNLAAPTALSYSTTSCVYTINLVITSNTPTITGTVTSWSVNPLLPAGLTLNTTNGIISGTPTATQSATNYTITATNSGGSTTATISITINNP